MSLFGDLKLHQVAIITRMKWNLQMLYVLEQWVQGNKIECKETEKLRTLMYIKDNALTDIAYDVYNGICNTPVPVDKKKKETLITKYTEEWKELWNKWPSTKSIPGKPDMKSTASAKSKEELCHQLYIKAVDTGIVTTKQLNWAAYVYIEGAIQESLMKGRNELQYRNGLEPWLRGGVYMNYIDQPEPNKYGKEVNNSVDM